MQIDTINVHKGNLGDMMDMPAIDHNVVNLQYIE